MSSIPGASPSTEGQVAVPGTTTGSHLGVPDDEEKRIPVICTAQVGEGLLKTWSIVEDTPARREELGLSG